MVKSYEDSMEKIECLWKKTRDSGFQPKDKDNLFRACQEGRMIYWQEMIPECKKRNWQLPPEVPSYKRAIMLLEHEERWATALELAKNAIAVGIENEWYTNRIRKYQKILVKPEGSSGVEGEKSIGEGNV